MSKLIYAERRCHRREVRKYENSLQEGQTNSSGVRTGHSGFEFSVKYLEVKFRGTRPVASVKCSETASGILCLFL